MQRKGRQKTKDRKMPKKKANGELNQIPLLDSNGKKIDTVGLDKNVFNGDINKVLLYQAITMYRANQRKPTASTKIGRAHV